MLLVRFDQLLNISWDRTFVNLKLVGAFQILDYLFLLHIGWDRTFVNLKLVGTFQNFGLSLKKWEKLKLESNFELSFDFGSFVNDFFSFIVSVKLNCLKVC